MNTDTFPPTITDITFTTSTFTTKDIMNTITTFALNIITTVAPYIKFAAEVILWITAAYIYAMYKAFIAAFNAAVEAGVEFEFTHSFPSIPIVIDTDSELNPLSDIDTVVSTTPYSLAFITPESWDSEYADIPLVELVVTAPVTDYSKLKVTELRKLASKHKIPRASRLTKAEAIAALRQI